MQEREREKHFAYIHTHASYCKWCSLLKFLIVLFCFLCNLVKLDDNSNRTCESCIKICKKKTTTTTTKNKNWSPYFGVKRRVKSFYVRVYTFAMSNNLPKFNIGWLKLQLYIYSFQNCKHLKSQKKQFLFSFQKFNRRQKRRKYKNIVTLLKNFLF